jgi:hypothetical protein
MKKLLTVIAMAISLCAFGQEGTQPGTSNNQELETTTDKPGNAIGVRMGYFTSIGASYQHFLTQNVALDINAGYRWKYGLAGKGPNTRIGTYATVQVHMLQLQMKSVEFSLYPAAGAYFAHANYDYHEEGGNGGNVGGGNGSNRGKFFVGGLTVGIGGDLRMGRFNLSGQFLPGIDLTKKKEVNRDGGWFINRCSGVSLRYILSR